MPKKSGLKNSQSYQTQYHLTIHLIEYFCLLTPKFFGASRMSFIVSKIGEIGDQIAWWQTIRLSSDIKKDKSAIHIVSAWLSESGLSIGQVKVDGKSNEIKAIPKLLDRLEIHHSIVSIDPMCSEEDSCCFNAFALISHPTVQIWI